MKYPQDFRAISHQDFCTARSNIEILVYMQTTWDLQSSYLSLAGVDQLNIPASLCGERSYSSWKLIPLINYPFRSHFHVLKKLIRDKNPSTLDIERNMSLGSKSNAWRRSDKMGWSNHNERGQLNAVFTGICWRLHSI